MSTPDPAAPPPVIVKPLRVALVTPLIVTTWYFEAAARPLASMITGLASGSSTVALVGGGSHWMRPGEASLAHAGVLFLDEMGEFAPSALDTLRQPLEEGVLRISRARASVTLPARFLLIGASNPCPCGFANSGVCVCSPAAIGRYQRRLSGPLLDRFDLRVPVGRPDPDALFASEPGESSASVAGRVELARARADERGHPPAGRLSTEQLEAFVPLSPDAASMLEGAVRSGRLTARGMQRIRAVARTLTDLADGSSVVSAERLALALALRAPVMGARVAA